MEKCVLIYDDDLETLNVCQVILRNRNYRVETLAHCENIIGDVLEKKPDLILMDLWIPEIGGENAVVLMKENPATRDVPVILFSANDDIEKISSRIHANGFLKKPFDISIFLKTIEDHLK
jgi:DNA-binding NtrC family response regulator